MSLHRRLLILTLTFAALAATAWWRSDFSYDLAFFLPAPQSDAQRVLIERLGQGPGAELIFVELPSATPLEVAELARELDAAADFTNIPMAAQSFSSAALPEPVWRHRLLLGDIPTDAQGWQLLLEQRLADLLAAPDPELTALIQADPGYFSLQALETLASAAPIDHSEGPPVLLLRSLAPVFELSAQTTAVRKLRALLAARDWPDAQLYGSAVYGVDLQRAVRRESVLFSALAGLALSALMLWRFRSIVIWYGAALPLLIGGAAGLTAVSLAFEQIHGITLAFGFTLLGVALDYPLHLFSHRQSAPGVGTARLWRTLLPGIASTVLAYGAFLLTGTAGLQQLGLFAATGILGASLATAFLSGAAVAERQPHIEVSPAPSTALLGHGTWLLVLMACLPLLLSGALFNDDLSTLTPVPRATIAADTALRQRLGVADLRYLLAVRAAHREDALRLTEQLDGLLEHAVADGLISGSAGVTALLPSQARQQQRRARLDTMLERHSFETAVAASQFSADAFEPFLAAARKSRDEHSTVTIHSYDEAPELSGMLRQQLYPGDGGWVSLVYLRGLSRPEALEALLEQVPGAELVDLKSAANSLARSYRLRLLRVLGLAALLVGGLLWLWTRDVRRVLWLMGSMLAAVAVAATVRTLTAGALSLFDLMALTLIAGLGLDYALFYSRAERSDAEARATAGAITICAASSLMVFAILAFSGIPLLRGIGMTVAVGVAAAYLLARFGRYAKPTS